MSRDIALTLAVAAIFAAGFLASYAIYGGT